MPQDVSAWSLSLPLPSFLRPAQPAPAVPSQPVAMPRDGYTPAVNRPAPNADPFADVQKLYQELMAVQDELERLAHQPSPSPQPQQGGFDQYDADHDGKLSFNELMTFTNGSVDDAAILFNKADRDGDGMVNGSEWQMATHLPGPSAPARPPVQPQQPAYQPQPPVYQPQPPVNQPQQPQQGGFDQYDADHDGKLNFNELMTFTNGNVDDAAILFNKADRDGDGMVNGLEWQMATHLAGPSRPAPTPVAPAPRPAQPSAPAQQSNDPDFQRQDTNHDNLLDFDELLAGANGDVDAAVAAFNRGDRDGDAKLNAAEWARYKSLPQR